MKHEDIIHIIVIDDSSNDAETVANRLRNAGRVVRAVRAEDDEDLRKHMAEHQWDLVLSKPEIPYFTAHDALDVIGKMRVDLPVLIIADDASDQTVTDLLESGARDAVLMARPQRLLQTLLREVDDGHKRRQYRNCERLLQEANKRAQGLVESSRDAIAYVHDGTHVFANSSYLGMFGYSDFTELEGLPIMDMVAPEDQGKFKHFLRRYTKSSTGAGTIEVQGLKCDQSTFKVAMEFSPAMYEGESCIQIIIRDQSLNKALEQKLDALSKQDLLTGVYNHQFFLDALKKTVGRTGQHGAVLYIRPDNFTELRRKIGIAASDTVLADIATVIKNELQDGTEAVARFESNIFTAILREADTDRADSVSQRIRDAVAAHISEASGRSVNTTCCIGIALYNESVRDPQAIITRAEKAYSQAVAKGGGSVSTYRPGNEEMADTERLTLWEKQLKHALRSNSFRLLYQPVVHLQNNETENYELLLRMLGSDGAEIDPGEFIPAAEKTGLMVAVDRWVLANAVKVLSEQRQPGKHTNFFVTLTGASVRDTRLLPWLRDLVRSARLNGNTLTLAVSESVASSNIKALKVIAEGARQLRLQIALENVGLAPNCMNLLKHCEADFVKIDGSLISRMNQDTAIKETILQITASAKETDKQVIAESVEDAQTLATIWSSGIDFIQGHFVQSPSSKMEYDFSSAG
ncbi:EAL domain-containing response regulator [Thiohalomonas denitrificans]|uniref:Response regulator receiver modulated diguanylate cyclase/phosphodiesterase n=1 Tax=Thiohalomonas denitrificans TaxID=415747 RepID=A0A1G5PKL5_9GAMM|nr:EAL domain-containing protein [Thiohalomonas denitrificans]SCZ50037.1 response regulator receiver modulated diguanylate cyclase/phosphodiesterase [Thiohalomonas denitrificans]